MNAHQLCDLQHYMQQKNLLVIGCGLTGSIISSLVNPSQYNVTIIDKARTYGGRMTTKVLPSGSKIDLGAQYITPRSTDPEHAKFIEKLVDAGVLNELDSSLIHGGRGAVNYAAQGGMSSIVGYYLGESTSHTTVQFNTTAQSIDYESSGGKWRVTDDKGNIVGNTAFDQVVVTIPVPQILSLKGDVARLVKETVGVEAGLRKVTYSTRYALGLEYDSKMANAIDSIPWSVRYITPSEDECLCYISLENRKQGLLDKETPLTMMVHASVPYSIANGGTGSKSTIPLEVLESVKRTMKNAVGKFIPSLEGVEPSSVLLHRWMLSQVRDGVDGALRDGRNCLALPSHDASTSTPSTLILAGDAFASYGSNYDGCLASAIDTYKILSRL